MPKSKNKIYFVCEDCGADHTKWQGQCGTCGAWNTLKQYVAPTSDNSTSKLDSGFGYANAASLISDLDQVELSEKSRIFTGFSEFDRVLGGGFIEGSVVLLGGDPGAGKSTLLLQALAKIKETKKVLYVTGEESLEQLAIRARRLGLPVEGLSVATETRAQAIANHITENSPDVVIIDSIQVMQIESLDSTPGSLSQVRETAAYFTRLAKTRGVVIVLVGHITKEGGLAGPKVLEHMIDCFMMLESPAASRFRTLRSLKNRFGAVNELGVFAMTERGMKEISNPSAIFLEKGETSAPGSAITVIWEGTRPMLIEIQALVDRSFSQPKRVCLGLDHHRLSMHLAALNRHTGVSLIDWDVFANVVGGVKISETASDLALLISIISSYQNKLIPDDFVIFGEIGLTGELRPVANGQERLREAQKHGFKKALIPLANAPKQDQGGMEIFAAKNLSEAIKSLGFG